MASTTDHGFMGAMTSPPPATTTAGLKANTLTLWDSTVIAVTSTAPAYSLAATMYSMIIAVGLASPAAILVSFVPVLGIAIAYFYMNRVNPELRRVILLANAGHGALARVVYRMGAGRSQRLLPGLGLALAGTNTLQFFNSLGWVGTSVAGNVGWTAIIGIAMVHLCHGDWSSIGMQVAARFQAVMLAIEYVALVLFSVLAFAKVASSHPKGSTPFSLHWLNPFSINGIDGLAAGAVLAVFFFWGWDTAANVNEETKDAHVTPGRAGIIGMFILLFVFLLSSSAIQSLLPQKTITAQGPNALQYFANQVLPAPWSYLMVLAILSSTVATLQTTLLPATRLTLSMARDRVWPRAFAIVHARYQTPVVGTIILTVITIVGLLLTTISPSISATINNLTLDIGVLVGFYYGITGLACAWFFRRVLRRNVVTLIFAGIFPFLSGIFLFWVGYQVVLQGEQSSGWGSVLPVLISFVIGIPLAVIAYLFNKQYFAYRAEPYEPGVTVPIPVEPAPKGAR